MFDVRETCFSSLLIKGYHTLSLNLGVEVNKQAHKLFLVLIASRIFSAGELTPCPLIQRFLCFRFILDADGHISATRERSATYMKQRQWEDDIITCLVLERSVCRFLLCIFQPFGS